MKDTWLIIYHELNITTTKKLNVLVFFGLIGYQSEGNHNKERNLLLFHVCVDVKWKSSVEIQ